MPTGEEIAAKLEGAVKESGSASDDGVRETLETVSEDAAAKGSKTSSDQEGKEGSRESKKTQAVPYDRFKQKVDQVQELETKLNDALRESERATKVEEELRQKVVALEQEASVLDRLRGLAEDPKYRPMLEALDKKLKGIEEEVEEGTKTEEEGKEEASKLVEQAYSKVEKKFSQENEKLAKARAEVLFDHANSIAERMLEALPETFDETDKRIIQREWNAEVEWGTIEEDPSQMRAELQRSFKKVVEEYGEPRGALKAKLKEFETKQSETEAVEKPPTPEEYVKGILSKEWSAVEKDDDGNVKGAKLDDDEFARDIANVLRHTRAG